MAGRIPQAFIDDLIARTDIVELIGGRVQLKKAGREWKACCPFHNEKTPSFWVSPDKQFYHWTRRVILALGAVYIGQGIWLMVTRWWM